MDTITKIYKPNRRYQRIQGKYIVVAWIENKHCNICGKFLNKIQQKYCSNCKELAFKSLHDKAHHLSNYCLDCRELIDNRAVRCKSCENKRRYKTRS